MQRPNSNDHNILILGSSGLLGWNLAKYFLQDNYNVLGTYLSHNLESEFRQVKLDIFKNSLDNIQGLNFNPTVIINTIACTSVDECESNRALAMKLNVESVSKVVELQKHFPKSKIIHFSTDQVQDGKQGNFKESELTEPVNFYGETKILGENIALKVENNLVIRTNFFANSHPWRQSLSNWIYQQLVEKKELKLFEDNIFNPISVKFLYKYLQEMILSELSGVYHLCGSTVLSKYDFGLKIADYYRLDKKLITPIKVSDKKLLATRPLNMSLNIQKIENALDMSMPSIENSIATLSNQG
tara:strand:- start:2047 stop:2946 length:900 start_codon:yes stop_codon:yes gene_type:complete